MPTASLAFWNALLSADLSVEKSRALLERLGSLASGGVDELLRQPEIGAAARRAAGQPVPVDVGVLEESEYPERMAELPGMWPALFVRGDADILRRPCVAIVGTRRCSPYGRACTVKFAQTLARAGVTIVSGLALGIDAVAHQAALEVGGKTAAVLPVGLERIYPATHGPLADRILASGGCILSQFGLQAEAHAFRFIARNHLIAALSDAVLIVEAPNDSGALTTARVAAEFGRDVLVVPGGIDRDTFVGSHALIRDGATLVYDPAHALEALRLEPVQKAFDLDVSATARLILENLSADPTPAESLAEATGLSAGEVLGELTMLELDGYIVRESGGYILKL